MSLNNQQPPNKLLIAALAASFLAIVGTGGILYYLGIFTPVTITKETTSNYQFAYIPHTGAYSQLQSVFDEADRALSETDISPIARAALLQDDPSLIPEENLRSKVGFILSTHDRTPPGLIIEEIPSRVIASATFNGSPVIGSYKAYSALKEWCVANGFKPRLPALEIYYDDGVVEYQLPISR